MRSHVNTADSFSAIVESIKALQTFVVEKVSIASQYNTAQHVIYSIEFHESFWLFFIYSSPSPSNTHHFVFCIYKWVKLKINNLHPWHSVLKCPNRLCPNAHADEDRIYLKYERMWSKHFQNFIYRRRHRRIRCSHASTYSGVTHT